MVCYGSVAIKATAFKFGCLPEWTNMFQTYCPVLASMDSATSNRNQQFFALAGWQSGWLAGWQNGWQTGWLAEWLASRLADWLASRMAGWLASRMDG